jgi:hypothetical protein
MSLTGKVWHMVNNGRACWIKKCFFCERELLIFMACWQIFSPELLCRTTLLLLCCSPIQGCFLYQSFYLKKCGSELTVNHTKPKGSPFFNPAISIRVHRLLFLSYEHQALYLFLYKIFLFVYICLKYIDYIWSKAEKWCLLWPNHTAVATPSTILWQSQ